MKKAFIIVVCALFVCGVFAACGDASRPVNSGVIRLHILANSDSDVDQSTKLQVRDLVLKDWGTRLMAMGGAATKAWVNLQKLLPDIQKDISEFLKKAGADYGVKLETGVFDFPDRDYNGVTFPQGRYRALRIELGAAAGHNWWCVMFPPLCLYGDGDMDMQQYEDLIKALKDGDDAPSAPVRSWLFDKFFGDKQWDKDFMSWVKRYLIGGDGN